MKNNITDVKLAKGFEHYTANSDFLGVETMVEFRARKFTASFIDSPFGQLKPSRTVKVVSNDNFCCKSCSKNAEYVTYQRSRDNDQIYIAFWIKKPNMYVPLTKDHIEAKSLGGTDAYENLQSLCYLCNQEKSNNIVDLSDPTTPVNTDKVLVDKLQFVDYKKKVAHFKYARKKIKKMIRSTPWYYRILGVDRFITTMLLDPMKDKGYFQDEEE